MGAKLADLREQLKKALTPAREIADLADRENRDLTVEESGKIKAAMDEATKIKAEIDKLKVDGDLRAKLADLGDGIEYAGPSRKADFTRLDSEGRSLLAPPIGVSPADLYVAGEAYKSLLKNANGGRFGEKQRVHSDPEYFTHLLRPTAKQRAGMRSKALITGDSSTSAGALVTPADLGLVVGLEAFERELTLRDVVTNSTTTSDTVEYARVTSATNNAAPVAEATSGALPTAVSSNVLQNVTGGGYKPESAMALERVSDTIKTIAHWIPATKRALSDAGQIRTLIDAFLLYGLEEEVEDQIINGNGTGENFEGLGAVSGTQSQAWDTDLFTTTRKAKTLLRLTNGVRPTAYVMNPEDVETIDLAQDAENRYYAGGPFRSFANTPLWGLPVVESEAVAAGTAWLGDWRWAILWDREQASITVSDSHGDYFIRNLVAILAEMRAGFGVLRPDAFVEIDLTA